MGGALFYNNLQAVRKSYPGVVKYVNFDSEISEVRKGEWIFAAGKFK